MTTSQQKLIDVFSSMHVLLCVFACGKHSGWCMSVLKMNSEVEKKTRKWNILHGVDGLLRL